MNKQMPNEDLPSLEQLHTELHRENYRKKFRRILRSTISTLLVVSAVAVLVAVLFLPVLQIYGSSMTPTLQDGDIVVSVKKSQFEPGELIAFYVGNKLLVKRYIAGPGQWVDLDMDGNVYVDGFLLEESYITEKAFGECNIELPYQVPESHVFCMGDLRSTSVDSRNTAVGSISYEDIVGEIVFRIWPLSALGPLT